MDPQSTITSPQNSQDGHKSKDMADTQQHQQVEVTSLNNNDGQSNAKSTFARIYRSTLFQICVVGALAFCGPAMADAISGLGGGGAATPWAVNAATAASYCTTFIMSILGGPLVSRLGVRKLLIMGAATFPINGSAYYINLKYHVQWWLVVGRAINGIGFGMWYVAESAIVLSYPEESNRGSYLAIWVMSRNLGQLVGGSISLARNVKNAGAGAIAVSTYLIFVAIEAVGFPISWLISPVDKVRRSDGTTIRLSPALSWKQEFRLLRDCLLHKRTLSLAIYFFYSYFYGGVLGNYLTLHFSVRARALSSLIVPSGIIIFVFLFGFLLDNQKMSQRRRAQVGFAVVMIPTLVSFSWLMSNSVAFQKNDPGKFDWSSSGWANAYIPFYMMQVLGYMCQTYIYWLISCFQVDVNGNARNGGVFRAIEAAGQAVSYGMNSKIKNGVIMLAINFGLCIAAIPGTIFVIQSVPKYREDATQLERAATISSDTEEAKS